MKRLVFLITLFCLSIPYSLAQKKYEVVSQKSVAVRKAPSVKSAVVGQLFVGQKIDVENTVGEWAVVVYNNKLAYVSKKFLKEVEQPKPNVIYEIVEIPVESANSGNYLQSETFDPKTNSSSTNVSSTDADSTSEESLPDHDFTGLSYTADFDYVKYGIWSLCSHVFDIRSSGFGYSLSTGSDFREHSTLTAKIGPNYIVPISKEVFFYVPLYASLNWSSYSVGSGKTFKTKTKLQFGLELTPSIGIELGNVTLFGGFAFGWTEKADKIATGFNVGLGYRVDL